MKILIILISHNIDFNNDKNNTIDECFIVRPNNARSDECHKGMPIYCNCQHNHPPPPPRKTPYNIKTQLQRIIDHEYILDLTARKLLPGSMIKSYLNGKALSDLAFIDNEQYIVLCATKQQPKAISELTSMGKLICSNMFNKVLLGNNYSE
ncbi:hypothetical protein GLOIN_2v1778836 [Rhizophagus clarus]|uniref:Uncharacterized protein n=1 Tax=Rhizophagus clarus TaxID=94130 RepID=A0A8H3KXK9_9GLOM|nr:hypothetical protein GLOIN_2v1778836 [Rhizophagus clarus]